jgi:hypothetical protein
MDNVVQISPAIVPLAELQKVFCFLKLSGEVRIVDKQEIAEIHRGTRSGAVSMYKLPDAKLLMGRYLETLPVRSDPKWVISDFMVSSNTTVYDAVAFSPLQTPATTLNFWVDPPVIPKAGDWSAIEEFLRNVICDGNEVLFAYLIRFLAHMLQQPEQKPGIMIVLLGGQGIGKGTLFIIIAAIWQHTTLQVSDVEHVTGNFNAAIETRFVICMDEAMFQGDKKAMDRIKSMITEPTVTTEQKHQPRRTIESFHRFFAASNHKHFATVDPDDRRFTFFRVSEVKKDDFDYWTRLRAEIYDPSVIAAMVHDLLALNLTTFNVRDRPKTTEHMNQKLRSLTGFDRYWFEVLQAGGSEPLQPWNGPHFVSTSALQQGWEDSMARLRRFASSQQSDVHEALARLCPSATRDRVQVNELQKRGYNLPSLPDARADFAAAMGGEVHWDD